MPFLQESCHTLPSIVGRDDTCKSSLFDRQASAAASVSGGFVASSSARATAFPSSSGPGTVRLINPRRSASVASNVLPVRINSMAALRPTLLGAALLD